MRRAVASALVVVAGCAPLLGLDDAVVDVDADWTLPDARIVPVDSSVEAPIDAPTDGPADARSPGDAATDLADAADAPSARDPDAR